MDAPKTETFQSATDNLAAGFQKLQSQLFSGFQFLPALRKVSEHLETHENETVHMLSENFREKDL